MAAKITLGGKAYPCRVTMGAMSRFEDETGHDISAIEQNDLKGLCMFLYCCVKSACNADKESFDMDFQLFADYLEPHALTTFYEEMQSAQKKTTVKTQSL